jgi:short-subunit dehydrogenase
VEGKGVTVQAVLPGATATSLWEKAGRPVEHLPREIVMTAEDMVDASLAGLDQHELITIPSLPDIAEASLRDSVRKRVFTQTLKPARRIPVPGQGLCQETML